MAAENDQGISSAPLLERPSSSSAVEDVELKTIHTANSLPTVDLLPSRLSAKDLKSFERENNENIRISLHQVSHAIYFVG